MTHPLEDRIRAIEDRLKSQPDCEPSAERRHRWQRHVAAAGKRRRLRPWRKSSSPRGRDVIANHVLTPEHQAAIAGGLAHFTGLPHVAIDGDAAVVTSYLQILVPQTQGEPVEVPNHGSSRGFRVHRMTANRWELVRTPQGWKIKHRTLRPLDGSEPARKILRQAIAR